MRLVFVIKNSLNATGAAGDPVKGQEAGHSARLMAVTRDRQPVPICTPGAQLFSEPIALRRV